MASPNPKILQNSDKTAIDTKSNIDVPILEAVKPPTESKTDDGVRDKNARLPNNKVNDAITFLASVFEGGESSKHDKDELDESILLDWLKVNVGDPEECQIVLNGVKDRVFKVDAMIDELRAMGHELTDDYVVDFNFFNEE
ncbi:hypothetical protein Tco_1465430 [Tanacetum coccineum]